MTVWQSIIIGLLQGLTEFLPVSSSGHMLLAGRIMGVDVSLGYELMMHLATLLAVLTVMRKEVFALVRHPLKKESLLIIIATVPTVIIVFFFKDFFEATFDGRFLPYCFLLTAILLIACGLIKVKKPKEQPSYLDAVIIGTVQGLAVLPGLSRSGSTISTGVLLGNEKQSAARFSFLLSIPIILGSAAVELIGGGIGAVKFLPLVFGFLAAFVAGLAALKFMIKRLMVSFDYFAIYLLALSIFLFLDMLWLHWL